METEKEIAGRLKSGDKTALKLIFDKHYTMLCRMVQSMVADQASAEDVVQELFIKLWNKREEIQIEGSVAAYLRGMAVKGAVSHLRRQKFFEQEEKITAAGFVSLQSVEKEDTDDDLKANIHKAIAKLPNRCRLIFQMSRIDGLTYREIAESLEISVKTVENQMGKALKLLRQELL